MLADILVFYAVRFVCRWWPSPRLERLTRLAMCGLLVVLSVVWLVQIGWRDFPAPLAIDFEDQATAEMYRLLDTPAFDGKQVLFGPSHEFTGTWLFRHNVTFPIIPPELSAAEFVAWLKRAGIDYILANREMIRRRQHSVGEYLASLPGEGVQILRLEPEWEVVYQGPPPSRFVLIRVH
jgi:endonuclease/exonuclease/phosphatase family metal-dependent hydrolase